MSDNNWMKNTRLFYKVSTRHQRKKESSQTSSRELECLKCILYMVKMTCLPTLLLMQFEKKHLRKNFFFPRFHFPTFFSLTRKIRFWKPGTCEFWEVQGFLFTPVQFGECLVLLDVCCVMHFLHLWFWCQCPLWEAQMPYAIWLAQTDRFCRSFTQYAAASTQASLQHLR